MEKLRKELGLSSLGIPNCFYASKEKNVIIMENLKVQGFTMQKAEGLKEHFFKWRIIKVV